MFKRTKVSAAALVALGLYGAIAPAQAQQPVQRVEVTGSRILSLDAVSASPLQVVSSEEIAQSGVVNIQDLLLKNPTFGQPAISRTNSNFSTASAGVSTIDLRDLGTDRTLVLVNGRRFVAGVPGSAAVDLNTIPVDFIERVEVLTGGSSAVYGSDAVAGVVNIVLKKNFEGIAIDMQTGQSEKGDDKKKELGFTFGTTSKDGRSNIMAHFGYSSQGIVRAKDRSGYELDNLPTAFFTGDVADMFDFTTPFFSSFAPSGRFFPTAGTGGSRTFDAQGNMRNFSTNGPAGDGVGADGFNRQDFRTLAIPTERYVFATAGETAINDSHSLFFEGTYAQTQTRTNLEPFPLSADDIYANGRVPAELRLANGTIVKNPLVPQAFFDLLGDTDGDGLKDYSFSRRLAEVGNRGNVADRDTFRLLIGGKGVLFQNWDYEVYAAYGATKESQVSSGQVNVQSLRYGLEAVPDVDDVDGDGNTTEAICLDPNARAFGCAPVSFFGPGSLTPEAAAWIDAPGLLSTFTSQRLAGALVRGELGKLPAGPIGIAGGFEYREEYSRSEFDALQQRGLNAGNAIPRTEGKFDVKELYVETNFPLLRNMPGAKSLDLNAAVRNSNYSTVGSTNSWSASLSWAPLSDVRFRATRALATRAPNINELFSPPSQTFESVQDPCEGITAASTGTAADRCRADAAVAANIAENGGTMTLTQADIQGTSGFDRGNPDLQEEQGKTWTLGVVVTPTSIPMLKNFVFTADYFNVEIEDAIVGTPRQFIVDQCYTGDTSFCQFLTRRQSNVGANSVGSIDFVDSLSTNSGGITTEGMDFTVAFADRVGPGRLNAKLSYTHLKKGTLIPAAGSAPDVYAGEIGTPKNKASLALGYSWGPVSVATLSTYIGKSCVDDQFLSSFDAAPCSVKVGEKFYTDMQVSYSLGAATVYLGIDNLFGTKPHQFDTNGQIPGSSTGGGASDVYDAIGRRYYVGLNFKL